MPKQLFSKRILTLFILSYAFFFFGNSMISLTNPDEVFYALTAKEMAAKGSWLVPYIFNEPQFEKPILTYWLLKLAFALFGETPFAARFFPAFFASFGVVGVYLLGLLLFKEERRAFLAAFILCGSALFLGMAKTVFTDMVFTVFILYAILSFVLGFLYLPRRNISVVLFFIFSALASLTKGPLGLLIPMLVIVLFLAYRGQLAVLKSIWVLIGLLVYLAVALPWYLFMYQQYGYNFLQEFFYNDHWRRLIEAEHVSNDTWYFYPITMTAGLFPWTLFIAAAVVYLYRCLRYQPSFCQHLCLAWVLVVFCIFQAAHSKLASYILPMFPALALMTGDFIGEHLLTPTKRVGVRLYLLITAGFLACLGAGVFALHAYIDQYLSSQMPLYFLSGSLIALSGLMITLVFKQELLKALYVLGVVFLPLIGTAFCVAPDIEAQVSSYPASQYLPHRQAAPTVIMTSKPYARGVRYYTGQDIAVMDIGGKDYFSHHPIPVLNTDEKLLDFLASQQQTFAVVKKPALLHLQEIGKGKLTVTVLKEYQPLLVIKIDFSANS